MCSDCQWVKEHYYKLIDLGNGTITKDPHGSVAIGLRKIKKQSDGAVFLVCVKEPNESEWKELIFHKPVLFCPFCGDTI